VQQINNVFFYDGEKIGMTEQNSEVKINDLNKREAEVIPAEKAVESKNELKTEREEEDDKDAREVKRRRIESSNLHDCGIQSTLSGSSFTAIIKQRYSDFIVNEMIRDSETNEVSVVSITDLNAKEVDNGNITAKVFIERLVASGISKGLAGEVGALGEKTDKVVCTPEAIEERDVRTEIHAACRDFGIDSKTLPAENKIEFSHAQRVKIDWESRKFRTHIYL
jgi:hypothetical protein